MMLFNIFSKFNRTNKRDFFSECSYKAVIVNSMIQSTVAETRKLLEEKQFSNSLTKSRVQKVVLLGTEISELADAVKKGHGVSSESEELADIVIRACNFLCSEETYEQYVALCSKLNSSELIGNDFCVKLNKSYYLCDNLIESKFRVIESMMDCIADIKKSSVNYCNDFSKRKNTSASFLILWSKLLDLFACCEFYSDNFLDKKLYPAIIIKMNKNFERPIRYNSCEDMHV